MSSTHTSDQKAAPLRSPSPESKGRSRSQNPEHSATQLPGDGGKLESTQLSTGADTKTKLFNATFSQNQHWHPRDVCLERLSCSLQDSLSQICSLQPDFHTPLPRTTQKNKQCHSLPRRMTASSPTVTEVGLVVKGSRFLSEALPRGS